MKTLNAIPLFSLVCVLTTLSQAANTSLTNSHARRSLERSHHHQRHSNSAPRRLDTPDADQERRRAEAFKRLDLDDLAKALGLPGADDPTSQSSSSTTTDTATSSSATDTASSTSSISVTDSASTTVSATDSASSTSATDSATSSSATDSSSSSSSATTTDSASSTPAVTDSATSTASVSDPPTSPTVSDPPASPTVSDPPSTTDSPTSTVSDPPASTTSCDPLDLLCRLTTAILPSDSPTSDVPVSTPAPTSDVPQTTDTPQTSDTPQTDSSTPTPTQTDTPVSTTDAPASTSDILSDILSSLFPTSTSDKPDPTTDSSTPTQSDKPTDTVTQSDQPTQTDTVSGTQTISQPPPTDTATQTNSFSDSNINTNTISASDSPTDSATGSVTRTESVSFPTLTSSPTDSEPTATGTDSIASVSTTDSEASVTMTTEPIPSEYSYITDSSLALTSLPATSTLALTLTDPDAAFTTASLTQSGTAAPSQAVAFPTQLPTRIFPANRLDPNDPSLAGMVLVSLKFLNGLTWSFVVNNSNTAALLFVYTPQAIANALGISVDQVLTFAMQAFAPADYSGDISQLSTVYLLYIPADQVDALQQQLLTQNSPLYVNQAGIPKQISQQLDATFPVNAVGLDTTIVGTGNTASGNNSGSADASAASRRDAIIGVCAAFGVILLAVVFWWGYKSWKRRQDKAHRRLTHDSAGMHQAGGYGATTQTAYGGVYGNYGVAPPRSGYPQPHTPLYTTSGAPIANPFEDSSYEEDPDERRRSFFYAEDSLRGYTVPREEDQGITYTQVMRQQQGLAPNDGKRRAPIQASAISAPILRESSLNW